MLGQSSGPGHRLLLNACYRLEPTASPSELSTSGAAQFFEDFVRYFARSPPSPRKVEADRVLFCLTAEPFVEGQPRILLRESWIGVDAGGYNIQQDPLTM